jgi:hypothetical protein
MELLDLLFRPRYLQALKDWNLYVDKRKFDFTLRLRDQMPSGRVQSLVVLPGGVVENWSELFILI